MDEILAVLKKKNPIPRKYSTEESWELFQETYSEELSRLGVHGSEEVIQKDLPAFADEVRSITEVKPIAELKTARPVRRRRLFRVAMIAAAIVVIFVAAAATAYAMGCNFFGWVPKWNESTIQYVPEDSITVTSLDIPTALKQLGVEEPLFPSWLPDGFILAEQQLRLDEPVVLFASYFYKDRLLSVFIRSSEDMFTLAMEKDQGEPIEYVVHGIPHYIYSNLNQTDSLWFSQGYCVKIFGDISFDEMVKIIDSVYDNEVYK